MGTTSSLCGGSGSVNHEVNNYYYDYYYLNII